MTDLNNLALTERESEVLRRHRAGETFTAIGKSWGTTPVPPRTKFIRAEYKEAELNKPAKCPCCGKTTTVGALLATLVEAREGAKR